MTHLSEQQARAIVAPWYSLFNIATRGDVEATQQAVLTEDYKSCAGYLPGECWGRDASIKVVSNFADAIPDMKFDVKEVLVAGDRSSFAARSPARRQVNCSASRTAATVFGSWPSISRPSATAKSQKPSTWKTG